MEAEYIYTNLFLPKIVMEAEYIYTIVNSLLI